MRFGNFVFSKSNRYFDSVLIPKFFSHDCVYVKENLYGDEHGIFWLGFKASRYNNVKPYQEHLNSKKEKKQCLM